MFCPWGQTVKNVVNIKAVGCLVLAGLRGLGKFCFWGNLFKKFQASAQGICGQVH